MAAALPVFERFTVFSDEQTCGLRWKRWLAKLNNLLLAMDVTDDKRKKALLLHYAGDECVDIYEAMTDAQKGIGATRDGASIEYETASNSFTAYFTPKKNTNFEVLKFRDLKQHNSESIDAFHTRLRTQASLCEFTNIENEILMQILQGGASSRLRRRAIRDDYTLDQTLKEARNQELSERRASEIEKSTEKVKALHLDSHDKKNNRTRHSTRTPKSAGRKHSEKKGHSEKKKCFHCGEDFPHKKGQPCPAKDEKCGFCSRQGHRESVCIQKRKAQGKRVKHVTHHSDSSEDDYVFAARGGGNLPRFDVLVGKAKQRLKFLADSGASVNLISKQTFESMNPQPDLVNSHSKIYAYGSSSPIAVLGQFKTRLQAGGENLVTTIQVVDGSEQPVLSWDTCRELRLLTETVLANSATAAGGSPHTLPKAQDADTRNSTLRNTQPDACKIADDFPKLFDGESAEFAKFKDTSVTLHIDKNVKPVAQRHRRVPFHTRKDVEKELDQLEERGIIEKVSGPTPWISPIVAVPKKQGGVRVCIDMREANKAIGREKHPMPTLDDLVADLNGATVFSKLDMSQAYHQLELDEASRYITTFSTHVGLRRYKRLLFGVNAASEIFQNTIATLLADIPGSRNLSDDIIVFGATQKDHDVALRATLARLNEVGARLNREKCVFSTDQLTFFGHVFGKDGVSADPNKIQSIINAPTPTNVSEIRSFLGMTQYVSRFIPKYASTGTSPFEALYGRKMNFGLPSTPLPTMCPDPIHAQNPDLHSKIVRNDDSAKFKMRTYADARRHTQPCNLQTGDAVLVKQQRKNKLTPPFCPRPYQVTARKGSMVTAGRGDHRITRNSSHFKSVTGDVPSPLLADEGEEDDDIEEGGNDAMAGPPTPRAAPSRSTGSPTPPTPHGAATPRNATTPRDQATPSPPAGRPQRQTKAPGYLQDYIRD